METYNTSWLPFPAQGSWVAIVGGEIWSAPMFVGGEMDEDAAGPAYMTGDDEIDEALVEFANSAAVVANIPITFDKSNLYW